MTTIRSVMTRAPLTVLPTTSVGYVLGELDRQQIRHLPVVDADGALAGIVSDRDVRAWRQAWRDLLDDERSAIAETVLTRPISELMTSDVHTVAPDAPIAEVATLLAERRIGAVVVVDGGRVVGLASAIDLLAAVGDAADRLPAGVVADRMTTSVFSVNPDDPVGAAAEVMLDRGVRHVPVVDDEGAVVGVVSQQDIAANGAAVVAELMSAPETVSPETTLAEAAEILLDNGYGCLPVVDNRELVGILTEADFVRYVAELG